MKHTFTEKYWEEHYQKVGKKSGSLITSPYLVEAVSGSIPGIALDAGCGDGGDAIWLAKHGWQVIAVDVSDTVLNRARDTTKTLGVTVDFEHADLTAWVPKANHFDLVTSHYVHTIDNQRFIEKLAGAVKPGGTLLIVGHEPPKANESSPHAHGSHITAEEIAAFVRPDEWDIEIAAPRTSERITPKGKVILYDSVFKARKK